MSSENSKKPTRYVIVTPVRNERKNIERTVLSVVRQTIRPIEWVIVDDGSTDDTAKIVKEYTQRYFWISLVRRPKRRFRQPGTGVLESFYKGYQSLQATDWEFIAKLDGDVSFEPDYFEKCFQEFRDDPELGIGGGTIYQMEQGAVKIEVTALFHVRGATKIYRRTCWHSLGGLLKSPGWDTVDEVKAHMLGWRTRSFSHLGVLHHRPTGAADGTWRNSVKNGRGCYIAGYHPFFMFLKCLKRVVEEPYFVVSIGLLYGYASSYFRKIPKVPDKALIKYLRDQQMRCLLFQKSIWK